VTTEKLTILTGNDLISGDVIWWTGQGWSRHINDATPVPDDGAAVIASESAAQRVVSAYAIAATRDDTGIRPLHIKERVRAVGPTVRLDLSLRPNDPAAPAWIA
jgi:hypothetical protein